MSVFIAISRDGKLDLGSELNKARLTEDLKMNPNAQYRIERLVPTRTNSQNALYWAYLGFIEHETGNLSDNLHEFAKRKFLPPKFITINGEEIKIPSSTTDLNKIQFGEYLDKICAWSNVPIPNPEDMGYLPR
jgi:hypothetical protein